MDSSAARASDITDDPQGTIRILVVINREAAMEDSITYLEQHNHEVRIAHSYSDAVKLLEVFTPDAVLVSWNLVRTDVKKVYKIFTERLKLICIVFAEDASMKTSLTLMNSGIHNHIIAPISGGTIQTKVEALINGEKASKTDGYKAQVKPVQSEAIPASTVWEKATNVAVASGENTIWKGSALEPGVQNKKLFYFKGPTKPEYNRGAAQWKNFEKGNGPIIMQERPQSEQFSLTQHQLESKLLEHMQKGGPGLDTFILQKGETDTSNGLAGLRKRGLGANSNEWKSAVQELQQSVHQLTKESDSDISYQIDLSQSDRGGDYNGGSSRETLELKASSENLNLLASCLKETMGEVCKAAESGEYEELGQVTNIYVFMISSVRFKGYVYLTHAANFITPEHLKLLSEKLSEKMAAKGEDIRYLAEPFQFTVSPISFISYVQARGDFVLSIHHETGQLVCGYFSMEQIPQFVEAPTPETKAHGLVAIDIQKSLVGNTQVTFDLYLYMKKNQKIIFYLKAGSFLTEKVMLKFAHFRIDEIYIKETDKQAFLIYCAKVRFLKG